MTRQTESGVAPKLLVSAVGMAITAFSGSALAQQTPEKEGNTKSSNVLDLNSTTVLGDEEGSYNVQESASSKYTAPLRDTPKSVTVVPTQVIRDTGALSLTDALRTVPGITFGAGEGGNPQGDRPFIRGFSAESDTFVDGMRDVASQTREIFNLEQIEVSKGPGSAYTGAGSTGGSLNLITKTPKLQNFVNGGFTYGSDQTRRTTLDVNQMITDNAAFRLNLMKHDANVAGRDGPDVSRWGVAPSISFGLGTPTRATFSYYHLDTDDTPDYGIPLTNVDRSKANPSRPAHVDKDNWYGSSRDYRKSTTDSGTFRIEHDLNDNLTLSNNFRMVRTTLDYVASNPDDSRGNVVNGYVYRSPKSRNSVSEGWVNQTELKSLFNTAGVEHTLVTGMEFSYEDVHNRPYTFTSSVSGSTCNAALLASGDCTSLYSPTPKDGWAGTYAEGASYTDTDTKTAAGYVFDTLKLNEQWSVNLGLRYDDFETRSSGYTTGGRGAVAGDFKRENKSHFWNYQAGVVYKPAPNGSIYVAWSTSSNPSGETSGEGLSELSSSNTSLEPERNRNYEIGTKWDFFNEALSLNAALFRTDKTNARVASPESTSLQVLDGEQRVQGVELGFSGKLTPQWKVFGGYTYLDSEIRKSTTASDEGNKMPQTPENNFTLWTTYDVTQDFTIGGGATYVDRQFGNTANSTYIPSYTRYDAMAAYRVTKNLDLQLNVQNLTDKRYFDQVYSTHMAHVAAGRTALLSANFHF
ncbi:iron transport outer membrane receptor [Pseudomonas asuensis]|uniref:Iron transport outer membrane receptor n=1 Tax=Pseudomonas asuensis TaxID=1825787 RepID=A0ABQ2GIE9_9PSED|nr:TonB-dependent siderophore receptor [Pseudomonas asuensis]GGL96285.1 iron transport outer membrane receptor [Pseudomonas asuensis]